MIEISLYLVSAQDGKRYDLGRATISLIGAKDRGRTGNYRLRILKAARYSRKPGTTWKSGEIDLGAALESRCSLVEGWPRKSKRVGPWELLLECLDGLLHQRRPEGAESFPDDENNALMRTAAEDMLSALEFRSHDSPMISAHAIAGMIHACAEKFGISVDSMIKLVVQEAS